MMTRRQLCQKYGISLATLRRALQKFSIMPSSIVYNQKNLPVYLYDTDKVLRLDNCLKQQLKKQRTQTKRCCVCHKHVLVIDMIGTRCMDCYIKKHAKLLIFGKDPWKRLINSKLLAKSIGYLSRFMHTTKKTQEDQKE